MTAIYGFNNTVTASGSYTLFPVVYIPGIAAAGGASVTFSGEGVFASVDTPKAIVNVLSSYSITASQGANVSVGSSTSGLISALSGSTMTADGGTLSIGGATIGALTKTNYVINNGGTLSITAVQSSAAVSALASSSVAFGSSGGTMIIQPGANLNVITFSSITGFEYGNAIIEIPGATRVTKAVNYFGNTAITFDNGLTIVVSGNFYDYLKNENLWQYSDGQNVYIRSAPSRSSVSPRSFVLVCYLKDSLVRTPGGEVPIQDLKVGDLVTVDAHGGSARQEPIIWTGRAKCHVTSDREDDVAGYPIRILAHAFARNKPFRDLLVTAEHCIFTDGAFVPIRMLVNGRTIFYDHSVASYEYFHIETPCHEIINVNGLSTETFLDTGNRPQFTDQARCGAFKSSENIKTWNSDSAAPLRTDRAFVEPLFTRLKQRSLKTNLHSPSHLVHISTHRVLASIALKDMSGRMIKPRRRVGRRLMFDLPPQQQPLYLTSAASRPCDAIGPFLDDRRLLGVLVGSIEVYHCKGSCTVSQHLKNINLEGWSNWENSSCRWTSGHARLEIDYPEWDAHAILAVELLSVGDHCIFDEDEQAALPVPRRTHFYDAMSEVKFADETPSSFAR